MIYIIPYFIYHSIIAFGVMFLWAKYIKPNQWIEGCVMGIIIYLSREYAQYEFNGFFDWKGLLFPIISNLIILYFILKRKKT
jgi:hypothetical protein